MSKLSAEELRNRLPEGWTGDETGISRTFDFPSYEAGVAFAVQVALLAQKANHHPDALTISWKRVALRYLTHSAGGVTERDLEAAQAVNAAYSGSTKT